MPIFNSVYKAPEIIPGWDMSKWTYDSQFQISLQWQGGISFKSDGTKMYISGGGELKEFNLSTARDITTASLNKTISLNGIEDVFITNDGTYLFYPQSTSPGIIHRLTMATPRDLSSAGNDQSYTTSQDALRSLYISDDGTKMFAFCNQSGRPGKQYSLSTPFDLTSTITEVATYNQSYGVAVGCWFKPDGTMYFAQCGENTGDLTYGTMATPRDLTNLTDIGTKTIGSRAALGMYFKSDGTMAFIVGGGSNTNYVKKYTLT